MGERWRKIEKGGMNERVYRVIDITYITIPVHTHIYIYTGTHTSSPQCRGRGILMPL